MHYTCDGAGPLRDVLAASGAVLCTADMHGSAHGMQNAARVANQRVEIVEGGDVGVQLHMLRPLTLRQGGREVLGGVLGGRRGGAGGTFVIAK